VDKGGIANPRPVSIGNFTEQGIAIKHGVQSGEMVAIAGVHTLVKGQRVTPRIQQVLQ
jgi:hypothetical protein